MKTLRKILWEIQCMDLGDWLMLLYFIIVVVHTVCAVLAIFGVIK